METMSSLIHNRRVLIALVIALAVVAAVVPTCRMVGCSMDMSGSMSGMSMMNPFGQSVGQHCGGRIVNTTAPLAGMPSVADSLTLAVVIAAGLALLAPRLLSGQAQILAREPVPPPEPPGGQRLRL